MLMNSQPLKVSSPNSFDCLRYFFAFSLVLVHFCTLVDYPSSGLSAEAHA